MNVSQTPSNIFWTFFFDYLASQIFGSHTIAFSTVNSRLKRFFVFVFLKPPDEEGSFAGPSDIFRICLTTKKLKMLGDRIRCISKANLAKDTMIIQHNAKRTMFVMILEGIKRFLFSAPK